MIVEYIVMFLIMTPSGLEQIHVVNAPDQVWCEWYRDVHKQILIDEEKEGDALCLKQIHHTLPEHIPEF